MSLTNKHGKVTHLVVDTVAFFKNSPIFDIGLNVYTISDVVDEIKDRATKERLQVLPREINFREPKCESIKIVSDFTKKTGDYPSLSAVDIRVLALTYELHKEYYDTQPLRSEPLPKVDPSELPTKIQANSLPGFYLPTKSKKSMMGTSESDSQQSLDSDEALSTDSEDDKGDDNEESWLASENLEEALKGMNMLTVDEYAVEVACITADFSMQNVLVQMGMKVASVDGLLIKCARTFILRCFGCLKTTTRMTSKFCPHCGNNTLKKVAVTINEDGSKTVCCQFRRPINKRGQRYSLPTPKGGKHASNPILCEDQPMPQNRPSGKLRSKADSLIADNLLGYSPFALNDIYSRAGHLGIRGQQTHSRTNPNQVRKAGGRKK